MWVQEGDNMQFRLPKKHDFLIYRKFVCIKLVKESLFVLSYWSITFVSSFMDDTLYIFIYISY